MKRSSPLALFSAWLGLTTAAVPSASGTESTATSGAVTAVPSEFGVITGRVLAATTGSPLPGAEVRIVGTAYETYADAAGVYRFPRVPVGTYHLRVNYIGQTPATQSVTLAPRATAEANFSLGSDVYVMEKFQVTSIVEGQARAINRQRAADTIVTVVASDDGGNLPDLSIEDVLSRVAGVSISGGGGVTIRGAAPDLNSVTLDGERMSAASDLNDLDDRAIPVANIDADLIGSIEVIRAQPPSMDADGIGGTVNLVTRSAFDLKKRIIRGRLDFTDNQIGKPDYGAAFTYGDVAGKGDRWGYILNLNYNKSQANSEEGEIQYNFNQFAFPVIMTMDARRYTLDKDSYGISTTIDHRLSSTTTLAFKGFYNMDDAHTGQYRYVNGLSAWNPATASETAAQGTVAIQRIVTDTFKQKEYYRLSFGGRTELDRVRLDYEANYDHATADSDLTQIWERIPAAHPNIPTRDDRPSFTYDRSDPLWPKITMVNRNFPGVDPLSIYDALIIDRLHLRGTPPRANYEETYNARLDIRLPRELAGMPFNLQFGGKFRGKLRKSAPWNARIDYQFAARFRPVLLADSFMENGYEPKDVGQGHYPTLGVFADPYAVKEKYLGIMATQSEADSLFPNGLGQVRRRLEEVDRIALRRTYTVSEDIASTYAMGTLDVGKLRLLGGARLERTMNKSTGRRFNVSITEVEPFTVKTDYIDLFPSLIATYRLTPNHVFRAGWTNTIARPNYEFLVPFETVPDDETVVDSIVDLGNPNLKAQKSKNFDLSYEWYFQPVGLLTVAAFQKDIEKFLYQSIRYEIRKVNIAADGAPEVFQDVQARIRTRRNGADAKLRGVELSWQHQLTRLPSPFDGLGLNANYTYVKGSSRIPDDLTGKLIALDYLFRQAKDVYNAQLFYEKYGLSARVGVRYNSGWNQDVTDTGRVVVNPTKYWDASLQYNLTRNFTVFVEGKNLTREILSWYFRTPATPTEWEISDSGYRGGVKYRF